MNEEPNQIVTELRYTLESAGLLGCDGPDAIREADRIIKSAIEKATDEAYKKGQRFGWMEGREHERKSRAARASETNQIVVESEDDYGEENVCAACGGEGRITTADYESYLGAMYKPCPECSENPCIGEPPLST